MEGEDVIYRQKFLKNWSEMKEVLSTQSSKLLDKCLEQGIVDLGDYEIIQSKLHDSDKIDELLKQVIKLKQFEVFLNIMDTMCTVFKELANRVRETVVDTQYFEVKGSSSRESDLPISSAGQVVNAVLKGVDERFLKHDEQLRQYIDKQVNNIVTDRNTLEELYSRCLELNDKYTDLQISYANARVRINELTVLAQQKNFENVELMEEIKHLRQKIEQFEEMEFQVENIESNNALINNQREQLEQLEAAYSEKERELSSVRDSIDKQATTIQDKERDLQNANNNIEELKTEKFNLQSQQADQAADKANDIMTRLDNLLRNMEIGSSAGITGRACQPMFKPRTRRH